MEKRRAPDTETFTGRVILIDADGYGPGSAQLLFGLNSLDGLTNMAFVVLSDTEPQVFSSMASMLTMAYRAAIPVTVMRARTTFGRYWNSLRALLVAA